MNQRTRIKMCGTTNIDDALTAVENGVDALGFIFFKKSPRNVELTQARDIIKQLPAFVDCVGVFVDESIEKITEIVESCGINHIQLHGKETVDYCRRLRQNLGASVKLVKAFRIGDHASSEMFAEYEDVVQGYLVDTYAKGQEGGTGKTFSWDVLNGLKLNQPIILAGGLTPDNIEAAITQVRPFAIDINSGVEVSPGKKDHNALSALIGKVRNLDLGKG